jgi:hypothetical protein
MVIRMNERKDIRDLEFMERKANELANKGDIIHAMDINDQVIAESVRMSLEDFKIREKVAKGNPSKKECIESNRMMMQGVLLAQASLTLCAQNTNGQYDYAITEKDKAAESCLWFAAAHQIAIKHLEGLTRTILYICEFRNQRKISDDGTYDLIHKANLLIVELSNSNKYIDCKAELEKKLTAIISKHIEIEREKENKRKGDMNGRKETTRKSGQDR